MQLTFSYQDRLKVFFEKKFNFYDLLATSIIGVGIGTGSLVPVIIAAPIMYLAWRDRW